MIIFLISYRVTLGIPMRNVVGLVFTSIALGHYPSTQSIHVYLHRHSRKGLLRLCTNPIGARFVVCARFFMAVYALALKVDERSALENPLRKLY
jgi:hypothetical protein